MPEHNPPPVCPVAHHFPSCHHAAGLGRAQSRWRFERAYTPSRSVRRAQKTGGEGQAWQHHGVAAMRFIEAETKQDPHVGPPEASERRCRPFRPAEGVSVEAQPNAAFGAAFTQAVRGMSTCRSPVSAKMHLGQARALCRTPACHRKAMEVGEVVRPIVGSRL